MSCQKCGCKVHYSYDGGADDSEPFGDELQRCAAHDDMMFQPDAESWAAKKNEVSARMTAAHYLVQFARSGHKPDNYDECLALANSYNPEE